MRYTTPVKHLNLIYAPSGDVTQFFGENPQLYSQFDLKGHNGIDIVRPWGSPLYAIEDGTVVDTKENPLGFGKNVRYISDEKNEDGFYNEWVYGHTSENLVKVGDKVKKGQHIANMGNTGFTISGATPYWATNPYAGTHLHLGLRQVSRPTKGGWSYSGSNIKIATNDYGNGYKGSIDPTPLLREMIEDVPAENKAMYQQLLTIQSIINNLAIFFRKRK